MKTLCTALFLMLLLAGCSGEDLKKQLAAQKQLLTAQETEIKRIKDDMAAREADLKAQCEQRIQKQAAQNKQQLDALHAKIAELNKKKDADKAPKAQPPKSKAKSRAKG